jgi:hypothetical protein
MENENQQRSEASASNDHASGPSVARRVVRVGLAFINPFSDLAVIYRTGIKPLGVKLEVLREQLVRLRVMRKAKPQEQLNWTQAVQRSGRPIEQLLIAFRRKRITAWLVMVAAGSIAFLLLLMILYTSASLTLGTIYRAAIADAVLASIATLSMVKVLETNYRLWQLASRRVSLEEQGTFQDYSAETDMWLQVMTKNAPY